MVTITKQEARDLILKCYKECISDNITELDISFNSSSTGLTCIEVKIPEKQQPQFRAFDTTQKALAVNEFAKLIESSSSRSLTLTECEEIPSIVNGNYFKTLLSFNIDCNCQLEE